MMVLTKDHIGVELRPNPSCAAMAPLKVVYFMDYCL
jgi:hypothetical protein